MRSLVPWTTKSNLADALSGIAMGPSAALREKRRRADYPWRRQSPLKIFCALLRVVS